MRTHVSVVSFVWKFAEVFVEDTLLFTNNLPFFSLQLIFNGHSCCKTKHSNSIRKPQNGQTSQTTKETSEQQRLYKENPKECKSCENKSKFNKNV